MSEKELAVLREMASHDLDAALKYAYSAGILEGKRVERQEKPKAIILLEQAWPYLTEENRQKLSIMFETLAFMGKWKREAA